ncbi:MAG TPA: tyrosine-type recombinase/integrase [Candidatus Saccharimonadales bacterium]|nr:tyrosine-type recombinase/integrase [Candidatus Saccharimonadales bacterium]
MLSGNILKELLTEYVEEYTIARNFSAKTLGNKRGQFSRLSTFLGEEPLNLTTLQQYVNALRSRGVTPNSIHTEIANIKAFLHWIIRKRKMQMDDWTTEIDLPKVHIIPKMIPDTYQAEQLIILGTEPGVHDHALHRKRKELMRFAMLFALLTGIRVTELKNIRGEDLDINENDPNSSKVLLMKAKGGTPQWQPIPINMLDELKKHVNDPFVFPICETTCNDALKRGAKLLGLPKNINMSMHVLRSVFGTTLARLMPMSMVCTLMRHSDISITQKFYICYGVTELGYKINTLHPIIRQSTPPKDAISTFIQNTLEPYFANDKRIMLSSEYNAEKREFVMRLRY